MIEYKKKLDIICLFYNLISNKFLYHEKYILSMILKRVVEKFILYPHRIARVCIQFLKMQKFN